MGTDMETYAKMADNGKEIMEQFLNSEDKDENIFAMLFVRIGELAYSEDPREQYTAMVMFTRLMEGMANNLAEEHGFTLEDVQYELFDDIEGLME